MRILITGGCGFIGGHLCRLLAEKKHDVVVFDNLSTGKYENVANIRPTPHIRIVDCRDYDFTKEALEWGPFDFVYHLASTVGVKRVLENPKECIENNIESLRAVIGLGVPGLFTSTSEVYGKNQENLREESDIFISGKSRWSYAVSKLTCEWLALAAGWNVVRLFNVVGPGQSNDYGAVLPRFISQALTGQPITVYGDGSQVRSFINVKDCVNILYELMEKKFGVVNVGSFESIPIGMLACKVQDVVNRFSSITYVPYNQAYPEGFEECPSRIPKLEKLVSLVGMKEYISLHQTIEEIAKSLKVPQTV